MTAAKQDVITIGITDCSKYDHYHQWISEEPRVNIVKLSAEHNNADAVASCDGVILSGGEDVHPRYYHHDDYLPLCEVNETRDAFEWAVLTLADRSGIPLLGICRGLQLANVFYGGTLIPHIPLAGKFDHTRYKDDDRYHRVEVDPNCLLARIVDAVSGEINSAHHQCVDRVASGLVANALSPDGVVEGLEREGGSGSFFQLVQWHPERMKDRDSAFSKNLRNAFVGACRMRGKNQTV